MNEPIKYRAYRVYDNSGDSAVITNRSLRFELGLICEDDLPDEGSKILELGDGKTQRLTWSVISNDMTRDEINEHNFKFGSDNPDRNTKTTSKYV